MQVRLAERANLREIPWVFTLGIFVAFGSLACASRQDGAVPAAQPTEPTIRAEEAVAPEPDDAFLDFVHRLDESISNRQADLFDRSFDVDAVVDRALSTLGAPPENSILLKRSAKQATSIGQKVLKDITENSAKYSFIRLHEKDGETRALFRITSSSGLNYHDLVLAEDGVNGARIVDIYIYISGELFSETLRRLYSQMLSDTRSPGGALGREGELLAKNTAVVKAMQVALQRRKFDLVLEFYHELPDVLRSEKVFLLQRLSAASALGRDDEYDAAVEELAREYPEDPALPLITLGYYSARERWDQTLKMIDALDAVVDDPYLDVMRASVLIQKREIEEAEKLALRAIDRDSGMEDAYWALITARLNTGDHEGVLEVLNILERRFSVRFEDLESVEAYSEFVKSEAYGEWKRAHASGD